MWHFWLWLAYLNGSMVCAHAMEVCLQRSSPTQILDFDVDMHSEAIYLLTIDSNDDSLYIERTFVASSTQSTTVHQIYKLDRDKYILSRQPRLALSDDGSRLVVWINVVLYPTDPEYARTHTNKRDIFFDFALYFSDDDACTYQMRQELQISTGYFSEIQFFYDSENTLCLFHDVRMPNRQIEYVLYRWTEEGFHSVCSFLTAVLISEPRLHFDASGAAIVQCIHTHIHNPNNIHHTIQRYIIQSNTYPGIVNPTEYHYKFMTIEQLRGQIELSASRHLSRFRLSADHAILNIPSDAVKTKFSYNLDKLFYKTRRNNEWCIIVMYI